MEQQVQEVPAEQPSRGSQARAEVRSPHQGPQEIGDTERHHWCCLQAAGKLQPNPVDLMDLFSGWGVETHKNK